MEDEDTEIFDENPYGSSASVTSEASCTPIVE